VTRWLAGIFDSRGNADTSRLAGALAPYPARTFAHGPLHVAYSDSSPHAVHSGASPRLADGEPHDRPPGGSGPLCLFDGYLDNFVELSAELEVPVASSTEALLGLGWRRWGPGLPARMRGDFALLIWDVERTEGLLARDQLGVRSLFLCDVSGTLHFACEVRHLLALLPRRPTPDPASLAHWLTMSNRPGSATLYTGVRRLDPGTMLLLDRTGVRAQHYWLPRFHEPLKGSLPEIGEEVRRALERSVARRVDPQGLSGVLMSGGLDSASVAAAAAAQAPGRIEAFSGEFPDHPAVDESALIDELRGTLGLPGVTAQVRPGGLLASALEAIAAWEMPIRSWGDFWSLPLLRASAARGVRVMLGGDGGDELFGARSYVLADRLRAGHPLQAIALVRRLPGAGYGPSRPEVTRMIFRMAVLGALPYRLHELFDRPRRAHHVPAWMRSETARELLHSDDPLAWKRLDGPRWWGEVAHGVTRGIEETGTFEHQRRRATLAGLEARYPLFDLDLLELCLRQPPLATLDPYRSRPVLRAAMRGMLPDSVRLRPRKALFDSLLIDCLTGPDRPAIWELLTDPRAELGAYVDLRQVRTTLLDGDRQLREQPFLWMWQVWRLVTAECWLRAQADPRNALADRQLTSAACITLSPRSANSDSDASYVFPP
jgi:asparagine synthase (glutamine-hydrolysing)